MEGDSVSAYERLDCYPSNGCGGKVGGWTGEKSERNILSA